MSLSLYQASVPVFSRMLGNLATILTKAEADATARGIDPSVFLTARLAPDMLTLTKQVQIASDGAKGAVARLAGVEPPSFPDDETTFPELQARITKTVAFIGSVDAAAIDAGAAREIVLKMRGTEVKFVGLPFLLHFALPNFYFHVTTAYDILRHNGVVLGKRDYLGGA
jgi:hypothetical protein